MIYFFFVFKRESILANLKDIISNNKTYPKPLREDLINIELDEAGLALEWGFGALKFIASLATMLGLLGTVLGMIDVFSSIAGLKSAVSPAMISSGIKKAMYTTAYGLSISIVALTVHYILSGISTRIFLKLEEYASILNVTKEYERLSEVKGKHKDKEKE